MITIQKTYSGQFTSGTQIFLLPAADDIQDLAVTVVEIVPIAAGSATISKSSAPILDIQNATANVSWFSFPNMPTVAANENMVQGAAAIKLVVTSGTWGINIRRGLD